MIQIRAIGLGQQMPVALSNLPNQDRILQCGERSGDQNPLSDELLCGDEPVNENWIKESSVFTDYSVDQEEHLLAVGGKIGFGCLDG
ncbi:hypothetical protein AKJ16_DCAP25234 [Drosera capensis]